jgi:hypothetical protein
MDDDLIELPELVPIDNSLTPPERLALPATALPDITPLLDEVIPRMTPPPVAPAALPSGSPFAPHSKPRPILSDIGRRGLPWERDPSLDTFMETVRWVICSPGDAFETMRRSDGFGSPLGFLILSAVLINFLAVVIGFVVGLVRVLLFWAFLEAKQPLEIQWDRVFLQFGGAACLAVTAALVRGTIGGFITAALYHLALLICGAARGGFQTTYRVIAFGSGSVYILVAIPLVVLRLADVPVDPLMRFVLLAIPLAGLLFALVMHFIVLTYGFRNAHVTSGGQAFAAVCLAIVIYVLFIVACTVAVLILLPALGMKLPRSLRS